VMPWNLATARGIRVHPSDNIEMLRALGRDPLVIKATRADAIWGLADMMDAGLAAAPRVRRPLLVLYGEKDDIVPRKSLQLMLQRLEAPYRLALYPDGYHMLFRDLNGETVWRDAAAWIDNRQAALPSGHEVAERPVRSARSTD
jgi:acylglycerol lipase